MNSDGDRQPVEAWLRVVRTHMDALQVPLEEALSVVPEDVRERVRARWAEDREQPIFRPNVLSGRGGRRPWFDDWQPSAGYHWRRLRPYLIDQVGRAEAEVESLDDTSDEVLAHLEDPRPTGPLEFRVQGLVLGRVQSGKTLNFSALIAKAADLGYKLVVVLSGIHNSLRQQTQTRLARELGLVPGPPGCPPPRAW